MRKIRKAVFPIGGLGTRFLPATKSMPKEMLPVVDRPLIQYAVDEAREAGIEQFIFVTSRGKSLIEDHFDHAFELEEAMARRGKSLAPLDGTRPSPGDITLLRPPAPLGPGHAVGFPRRLAGDEAREAGIEQFIFVTSRGKSLIEDHFDHAFELEEAMARRGKSLAALDGTRPSPGDITIVRQQEPLGLGHAVWCARRLVGDEPFAVLLPDDLMVGEPGCLQQMVEAYHDLGGNLICTEEVAADQTPNYGILTPDRNSVV